MKHKPIIGITPLYDTQMQSTWMLSEYISAIEASGGIPLVLSINSTQEDIARLLDILQGVLLPGGQDISPLYYGESVSDVCGPIVPFLDQTEIMLARMAHEKGKALMGVCRGCQLLNVALGGSLHQDISSVGKDLSAVVHNQKGIMPKDHAIHSVKVQTDSCLYKLSGKETLMVNSLHHQAVKAVAPCLKAVATAADGIIECIENRDADRFVMGVQWHPELLFAKEEHARAVFKHFIEKAATL